MGKGTVTSEEHVDVKWAERNDVRRQDEDYRRRRGREVRRQRGDEIDKLPRRRPSAPRARAEPAPSIAQVAVFVGKIRQHQMIFDDDVFSRSTWFEADRAVALARSLCTFATIAAGEAGAQSAVSGVPNAMQGFSQNRDQPIQIEAAASRCATRKRKRPSPAT